LGIYKFHNVLLESGFYKNNIGIVIMLIFPEMPTNYGASSSLTFIF